MAPNVHRLAPSAEDGFEAEWRARFGRFAARHVEEAAVSGWSRPGLRRRFDAFRTLLHTLRPPVRTRALDVGCGAGTYVRALAGEGYQVVGLDYSLPTLSRAIALDSGDAGRYLSATAYALPFPTGTFDLVLSIGVLQALSHPQHAIIEMARVLARGGVLVLEALNAVALTARTRAAFNRLARQPSRVRMYRPAAVAAWLRCGGIVLEQRVPILLPPRRLPGAAPLLESRLLEYTMRRCDWICDLGAHAFIFVGRKSATPTRTCADSRGRTAPR